MDLAMLAILNGKERCLQDWHQLVKRVDSKLVIVKIHRETHGAFGIIELALEGE
jgi:hypothetical protein